MSRTQPRRRADFGNLKPAEAKLLAELDTGQVCVIGDVVPPEDPPEDVVIRASFLRWCILRGPEAEDTPIRVHEKGVRVCGAYILGDGPKPQNEKLTAGLDLEGCMVSGDIILKFCRFPDMVLMRGASLATLNIVGSRFMSGLYGDALKTTGSIVMEQVKVDGPTRLLRARIDGGLLCEGGKFKHAGRDEDGHPKRALDLGGAEVRGSFFWRKEANIIGVLGLTAARIGFIIDDAECWPAKGHLLLNRCTYTAFSELSPIEATSRLKWLALQDPERWGQEFWPQPYEQLAKVLREAGHEADARVVLIRKEHLQRKALRGQRTLLLRPVLWLIDQIFNVTVRYGRRPLLAFAWLAIFWSVGAVWFATTEAIGALKPNTAFVLRAPEWVQCADGGARRMAQPSQYACFLDQPEAASYPRFNAAIYSADTLLPIVALEMQHFWIPDETRPFGWWARVYLWVQIAMGWALSLLAVAGFSGLIRSDAGK